jgi:hypothetical protein
MACTQASATSPEPSNRPPAAGTVGSASCAPPGSASTFTDGPAGADDSGGVDDAVVSAATGTRRSSVRTRKNVPAAMASRITAVAAMISGTALLFLGGCPNPPGG